MSRRVAVVTSSPPMSDGGHMVIARSLVQALRDAGHQADVIVTPQNRFGRQASEYLATWLTDVEATHAGPIDQAADLLAADAALGDEQLLDRPAGGYAGADEARAFDERPRLGAPRLRIARQPLPAAHARVRA